MADLFDLLFIIGKINSIFPLVNKHIWSNCVWKKCTSVFFDVDWNPKRKLAVPISSMVLDTQRLQDRDMVPTVFITTRTLDEIPHEQIPILAKRIYAKIKKIAGEQAFREIQLDCDWTVDNQDAYFYLISEIRNLTNKENILLSSTIHLHHLKYIQQMGIPPVDRGNADGLQWHGLNEPENGGNHT